MSDIHTWSTTAANNNAAVPNGWPEGMAASGVNNAGRELMAAMAKWYKDTNGTLVSGGSSNAFTLTPNRTITAYEGGLSFTFEANHTTTTTTPTLNVSSLGAKTITDQEGAALTIGDIVAGGIYTVTYDAGEGKFKLISAFVTASGMVPFAYGRVSSTGVMQTGSFGIASVSKPSTGSYSVTLSSGVSSISRAMAFVTPMEVGVGELTIGIDWISSTSITVASRVQPTGTTFNTDFSILIYNTN